MLLLVAIGGLGASILLVWLVLRTHLEDTRKAALFWILWAPTAIGGGAAGALLGRGLGLS